MARQDKKEPKDKPVGENRNSQRKGSAFNEKPGPQPAHVRTGAEENKDRIENNDQPPGVPERNKKDESAL